MINKLFLAALVAASFCTKVQSQTIEVTNTLKNGVQYVLSGTGTTGGHDEKVYNFLVYSKDPNNSQIALMREMCYDFDTLPFPIGVMAVVTIIDKETNQQRWEYWRSFDKKGHSLCLTETDKVLISIVKDPKNPK